MYFIFGGNTRGEEVPLRHSRIITCQSSPGFFILNKLQPLEPHKLSSIILAGCIDAVSYFDIYFHGS
jgi:hypothetical protein